MRYRKLDPNGDYTFGANGLDFYVDSPEAVGQAVETRLLLMTGEWFLDQTAGTPYLTQIVGKNTSLLYDAAIRDRILNTEGVTGIAAYQSEISARALSVSAKINTQFGQTTVQIP